MLLVAGTVHSTYTVFPVWAISSIVPLLLAILVVVIAVPVYLVHKKRSRQGGPAGMESSTEASQRTVTTITNYPTSTGPGLNVQPAGGGCGPATVVPAVPYQRYLHPPFLPPPVTAPQFQTQACQVVQQGYQQPQRPPPPPAYNSIFTVTDPKMMVMQPLNNPCQQPEGAINAVSHVTRPLVPGSRTDDTPNAKETPLCPLYPVMPSAPPVYDNSAMEEDDE